MRYRIFLGLAACGLTTACGLAALREPALPPPPADTEPRWLDQNWTDSQRQWFHHASQGTSTFPVPYAWFMALEQPRISAWGDPGLLADEGYLRRFGFIPSPKT